MVVRLRTVAFFISLVLRSPLFFLKVFIIGCLFHFRLKFKDRLQKLVEFVLKFIDRRVKKEN